MNVLSFLDFFFTLSLLWAVLMFFVTVDDLASFALFRFFYTKKSFSLSSIMSTVSISSEDMFESVDIVSVSESV